jgi:hypothetical protein
MYGWKGKDSLTAETFIIWLASHMNDIRIVWSDINKEHIFINDKRSEVASYPTPLFLQKRLELSLGYRLAGVALWELGQMMSCFLTLF